MFPPAFRDSSVGMTSSARNLRFQRGTTTECMSQRIAFRPCGTQCGTTADCHGTTADEGVKSSSVHASASLSHLHMHTAAKQQDSAANRGRARRCVVPHLVSDTSRSRPENNKLHA